MSMYLSMYRIFVKFAIYGHIVKDTLVFRNG